MNTPATTPAPQKITPPEFVRENRYIVIKRKDAMEFLTQAERAILKMIGEAIEKSRKLCARGELRCIVVESDWPEYEPTWAAIEARMTGSPQPTHSAQEAASIDWKIVHHALKTAQQYMEEGCPKGRYTWLDAPRGIAEQYAEGRHFPSTPTQSQQPPSPGSGEAMREALKLAMSLAFAGMNGLSDAEIEHWANDSSLARDMRQDAIDCLKCRKALAQPATPPLTSGENSTLEQWLEELSRVTGVQFKRDRQGRLLVATAFVKLEELLKAPPLPSIGDGKDGERLHWLEKNRGQVFNKAYGDSPEWAVTFEKSVTERSAVYESDSLNDAIDKARAAQSPQSGREEK